MISPPPSTVPFPLGWAPSFTPNQDNGYTQTLYSLVVLLYIWGRNKYPLDLINPNFHCKSNINVFYCHFHLGLFPRRYISNECITHITIFFTVTTPTDIYNTYSSVRTLTIQFSVFLSHQLKLMLQQATAGSAQVQLTSNCYSTKEGQTWTRTCHLKYNFPVWHSTGFRDSGNYRQSVTLNLPPPTPGRL
jgi:hypothetical protein